MLKFKKFMNEETQLVESHFKVGQKVKCVHSGKEGVVTKVDPSEKGKYYTVKRDDGEVMQYAPDDLEALKEEVELDEADTYAIYKKGKVFDTFRSKEDAHDSLDSMGLSPISKKDYRVRKLPANHKNDWSMREEVELDEISKRTLGSYVKKAGASMASHGVAVGSGRNTEKSSRAMANRMKGMNRAADRLAKEELELDEISDKKLDAYRQKAFADQPAGDDGSDKYRKRKRGRDLAFAKQTGRAKVLATKEEVELDEAAKMSAKSQEWYDKGYAMGKNPSTYKSPPFGIGGAAMDAFRKGRKAGEAAVKKEEVELDETKVDRMDLIRKAVQRVQAKNAQDAKRAAAAAKRDMKAKGAQRGMAPVKKDLEEGRNEALKALEGLAKRGGMDKADFQKAHDLYKAGKLNDLRKHIYRLDTDPSEAIADVINRHDSKAFNSMYPRAKAGDYLRSIVLDHGGK